jgi:hypothetical protein
MWPVSDCVVELVAKTSEDGVEHVGVNFALLESGGERGQTGGAMSNGSGGGAMEDVLKVFMVEGGASWAASVE